MVETVWFTLFCKQWLMIDYECFRTNIFVKGVQQKENHLAAEK